MKRVWFGAGLLLFFLVAGILLTLCFHRIHAPLAQTLEDASHQAVFGDWEQAVALSEEAQSRWESYRNFTAAIADHEPLEEMDGLFDQMELYAKLGWKEQFASLCIQLSQMAAAMDESQQLTWWTLL